MPPFFDSTRRAAHGMPHTDTRLPTWRSSSLALDIRDVVLGARNTSKGCAENQSPVAANSPRTRSASGSSGSSGSASPPGFGALADGASGEPSEASRPRRAGS
jgi:hypothetical protein